MAEDYIGYDTKKLAAGHYKRAANLNDTGDKLIKKYRQHYDSHS
jgi:hypothetical protein